MIEATTTLTRAETESLIKSNADSCNNIFCSFVVHSTSRLSEGGALGAITDRSFVVKDSYEDYRRWLYKNTSPNLFVDLGWGVLDANVEVCCYVVKPNILRKDGLFLNLSKVSCEDKSDHLLMEVAATAVSDASGFLKVSYSAFENIPHFAMSYFLPPTLISDFAAGKNINNEVAKTARGMSSGDTFMACRLLWEVPSALIGSKKHWNHVNVGGGSAPLYRPQFMVFRYSDDWGPLRHLPGFSLKNVNLFWRTSVGWGKRTDILSAQLLPPGLITAEDGQIAVPFEHSDAWLLLGFLNSKYAQSAIHCICGGHKGPGYVGSIPFPALVRMSQDRISKVAAQGFDTLRSISVCNETTLEFCHPFVLTKKNGDHWTKNTMARIDELLARAKILLSELDEVVFHSLEKSAIEQTQIIDVGPGTLEPRLDWPGNESDLAAALASYALGVAYGRWDIRFTTGEISAPELPDPFAPLPICAPGQFQNEQGLPITQEDVERFTEEGRREYPIEISWDGILVDDPGHPLDIETHIHQVLKIIWGDRWEAIEREACDIIGVRSLRDYFRMPTGFFADHLKRYSKSRRKAPIYWPLSTKSASYTVWIYYHRFNRDTFFQVLDLVKSKLEHESGKLRVLQQEAGPNPGSSRRKAIEEHETFVEELSSMRDEVARISPLWNPNLNDGVIINYAPLWRLVPQSVAWQKECRATWDKLVSGDYDWSHLAMHLWPERVVPSCQSNRSLAIAHGLDEVFWENDERGKSRPIRVDAATVVEMITERTSPAVKAALQSLLDAPTPRGSSRAPVVSRLATSPRARTKSETASISGSRGGSAEVDEGMINAVRQAIANVSGGAAKADVLIATGLSVGDWSKAINSLLASGDVTRSGEKRGTRYHASSGEEA